MEVFLARFGDEAIFFSEDDANFAVETITCFFKWIVTTTYVKQNETGTLIEKFNAGVGGLRQALMPRSSAEVIHFDPWPQECRGESSLNSMEPKTTSSARLSPKIGRNDPCPCASARKHKKCCWAEANSMAA